MAASTERGRARTLAGGVARWPVVWLLWLALPPAPADAQALFINELHYDNAGVDVGEGIEIAGEAGTHLDGWRLVLYGNAGSPYAEYVLSGTIPALADGFGVSAVMVRANGLQNGPGDGVALVDRSGTLVQFVSYEGAVAAIDGPAAGHVSTDIGVAESSGTPVGSSLQLAGRGRLAAHFAWTSGPASFGAINAQQVIADLGPPRTERISAIQGDSARSPLEGRPVIVEGVVTASFQGREALDGFFIQEAGGDGDAATSDGLFVHVPGAPLVPSGTVVRVVGLVRETFGQTELANVSALDVIGAGDIVVTPLALPLTAATDFERFEGMLIALPQPMTVTGTDNLGRFGEVLIAAGGRLTIPTNALDPNDDPASGTTFTGATHMAAIDAALADQRARTLVLDDGLHAEGPDRIPLLGAGETVRVGTVLHGVTGVLAYEFGGYRVHPTQPPLVAAVHARPETPPRGDGRLRIASFNVLNFFTTLGRRGANTAEELDRQRAKIVAALRAIDADIVGLVEIEANGDGAASAVAALTDALNSALGARVYDYIRDPPTGVGDDEIKVALLYKSTVVAAVGDAVSAATDLFERRPVGQTFRERRSGEVLTVIVNHFRSKRGPGEGEEADVGQGAFNRRRVRQAEALAEFAAGVEQTSHDPDVLLLGDLNAYGEEDPVDALRAAGFSDMPLRFAPDAYIYVFDGQAGLLDHALASSSLEPQVTGAAVWHINADEPAWLDYNLEGRGPGRTPDLYAPTPFRSSDHDPVLVEVTLGR